MNRNSRLIIFVAVLASLLEIVDSSIVNVAIPTMMGSLGATLEDISMVITGYAIANAVVLPLSAWLGERIGRRTYYLGCIGLFILTSVACGFAPNLSTLIVFRILQGLAGGALLPTSQTLIYEQFPKEKAGIAGAIFGMSVMIGPALGPVLGGYLTDQFGWRSIFNINLPLGILALFVGYLVIHNPERAEHERVNSKIDIVGLMLLCAGIGCLQYVLERGQPDDWFESNVILTCAIVTGLTLPFFAWWELRVTSPILNLRLLKDPIVLNGVGLMACVGFFLYAVVFVLPVFIGTAFHYDATQTGMMFIPGSVLTAMMMPFIGRSMGKVPTKLLIAIGFLSIDVFAYMMTHISSMSDRSELMRALYVRGFAMAFLFVPINSSILSQFKGPSLGQVSGMMNLSRQLGGSVGIALVATLLSRFSAQNYIDLVPKVSMLEPQTQVALHLAEGGMGSKMVQGLGAADAHQAALRSIAGRVQAQVFMQSFDQLMWTVGFLVSLAFIPLYFLKLRAKPQGPISDH